MRKFKLIKNYPDSLLKIGELLIFNENQKVVVKNVREFDYEYSLENCINYPEFWKEVVEKNYEILSVITNNNKFIEKVYNQDATIEPYWEIHSVKRLSDGEV